TSKTWRLHQDQHVEWIAVEAEGTGNEPVVAGIVDGRKQRPIQTKHVELLVVLVLVDRIFGDLDDGIDQPSRAVSNRKRCVISHLFTSHEARTLGSDWPLGFRPQPSARLIRYKREMLPPGRRFAEPRPRRANGTGRGRNPASPGYDP